MGLIARPQGTFYGPTAGRDSQRKTMAVVAEANDLADRFLRMVVNGRPLNSPVMQLASGELVGGPEYSSEVASSLRNKRPGLSGRPHCKDVAIGVARRGGRRSGDERTLRIPP